jgi:hypothetical protein
MMNAIPDLSRVIAEIAEAMAHRSDGGQIATYILIASFRT